MLYAKTQMKLNKADNNNKKKNNVKPSRASSFSDTHLICPRTSGLFFVRFMLESKGTSKYCGKTMRKMSQDTMIKTRHHTVMQNVRVFIQ